MKPSARRWFALLILAAFAAVAFGAWEVASGRSSFGVGLIVIAVADVLFVGAAYAYRKRR
jgi:hypothetical protein